MEFHIAKYTEIRAGEVCELVRNHPRSEQLLRTFHQTTLLPPDKLLVMDKKDIEALRKGETSVTDIRKSRSYPGVQWHKKRLADEPIESTQGKRAAVVQSQGREGLTEINYVSEEVATASKPEIKTNDDS